MRKRERGFTLVELMVVIAIIALLAAILFPNLTKAIQKGRITAVISGARNLYTEMSTYYADHGYYPVVSDGTNWSFDTNVLNVTQGWPWDKTKSIIDSSIAEIKVTDPASPNNGDHMQQGYIYWTPPAPAQGVAKEMAGDNTCPSDLDGLSNDTAYIILDLTENATDAVYICKK